MARMRTIKPDVCSDEKMAELDAQTALTFIYLWTHLDDDGRCADVPLLIKAAIYPLVEWITASVLTEMLDTLVEKGLLIRYESGGKSYLYSPTFHQHQRPQKKVESKCPAPPPIVLREDYCSPPVAVEPVVVEVVVDVEGEVLAPTFVDAPSLELVPSTPSKPVATRSLRPPDLLWDAVVMACGLNPSEITNSMRGALNRALADLREVGATPEQVPIRAARYRKLYDHAALTATALAKHWASLASDTAPSSGRGAALARAQAAGL